MGRAEKMIWPGRTENAQIPLHNDIQIAEQDRMTHARCGAARSFYGVNRNPAGKPVPGIRGLACIQSRPIPIRDICDHTFDDRAFTLDCRQIRI